MQDNEIFNILKGNFYGLDLNNETQYQQAIQQIVSNPYIQNDKKNYLINSNY